MGPPEKFFQIQKRKLQTVRADKVDESQGVICLVSVSPSWVMVVELSKKVFLYVYTSEKSLYARLENNIVYYTVTYCFEDIMVWSRKIL